MLERHRETDALDAKHEIIVDAQAHGTGSEQALLILVVEALAALEVPALIADPDMRKRDEWFADREHHTTTPNPLHDKSGTGKKTLPVFAPSDFTDDADARTCVCPAGKSLHRRGASSVVFFRGREDAATETHTMHRQQRLDTADGREQYGQRFGSVEPVFGNVRYNKRPDSFTLRGRTSSRSVGSPRSGTMRPESGNAESGSTAW